MTGWRDRRKARQLRELLLEIAGAIIPENALWFSAQCSPVSGHGLWAEHSAFSLFVANPSPVVLLVSKIDARIRGWSGGQILESGEQRLSVPHLELTPGSQQEFEVELPIRVEAGAPMELWRAVHVEIALTLQLEGPTLALCTPVKRTICCWMPFREAVISQKPS
jgi:hypothetical protein